MISYEEMKGISDFLRIRLKDKIDISDFGSTIIPKGKKLSKGCYSCKSGSWICIYIGVSCNLKCISCPQTSRHGVKDFIWANGGNDDIHSLEDLKRVIDRNKRIDGISFSGGEPFLYLNLVKEWLDFINKNFYDLNLYKWIYTNGMKVTKEDCEILKEKGINEIRFDLAATNYSSRIIDKLKYSKTCHVCNKELASIISLKHHYKTNTKCQLVRCRKDIETLLGIKNTYTENNTT